MNYEAHFEQSYQRRSAYWNSIGQLNPKVLGAIISQAFMDGPRWPSMRQAFAVVDTPNGTILASEGLSDPYDDFDTNREVQNYNGIGFELYIESTQHFKNFEQIQNSWEFALLYQTAQFVVNNSEAIACLTELPQMSTELYHCKVPEHFKNSEGRCGALLGLPSTTVADKLELSIETIRLVNITLLTLPELQLVIEQGEEGRELLASKLKKYQGKCLLQRESEV